MFLLSFHNDEEEPSPEEKKEEKRKPGRPKLSPSKWKNTKNTDDKYTLTEIRKNALEKFREIKRLKREGKLNKEWYWNRISKAYSL